MHDLDRAMFEAGTGGELEYGYESPQLEQEEFLEVLGEVLGGGNGASREASPRGALERRTPGAPGSAQEAEEEEEAELALELLEISSQEELDRFFGGLMRSAAGVASKAVKNVMPHLGDIGMTLATSGAIPALTQAAGSAVGGSKTLFGQTGGEWGKRIGEAGKSLFGLELEGLSQEDREFETARALVRWAKDAAQQAAAMTPQATARPSAAAGGATRQVPPAQIAKAAAVAAAQRVAPGLAAAVRQIPVPGAGGSTAGEQSGRWVRRGNTVVLHGFQA